MRASNKRQPHTSTALHCASPSFYAVLIARWHPPTPVSAHVFYRYFPPPPLPSSATHPPPPPLAIMPFICSSLNSFASLFVFSSRVNLAPHPHPAFVNSAAAAFFLLFSRSLQPPAAAGVRSVIRDSHPSCPLRCCSSHIHVWRSPLFFPRPLYLSLRFALLQPAPTTPCIVERQTHT